MSRINNCEYKVINSISFGIMQDVLVFAEGEETGKTDSSITLDRASKLVNVVMALLGYKEE